jgi:hypothetical protein
MVRGLERLLHCDERCPPQVDFHREENISGSNEEQVEERADKDMRKET